VKKVRDCVGDAIFGEGEDHLEEVVGKLLQERKKTVATAESCTGGLLASLITDVPGASEYFREGVVTYSNEAKQNRLGSRKRRCASTAR
jgi:nicotinamide-nucleotide amidase